MTTTELVRSIGRVSLDVQRQPIKVTLRGDPVAVLVPYEDFERQHCVCGNPRRGRYISHCPVHGEMAT